MEKRKFSTTSIKYTDDQDRSLNSMLDFLYTDDKFYTLEGAAGTGKTTVLKEFIKQNKFTRNSIAISAPTHKAVRIASQMTGLKGATIQKLLGLRPNMNIDEYDINKPSFAPRGRKAIQDYSLVIIDECSMINTGLYKLIVKEANQYKTKVVFVGDAYQLPPVKEKISPTFTDVTNKSKLLQIVRQSEGNPLLELLDVARADVRNSTFNLIGYLNKNKSMFNNDGQGFSVVNDATFAKYLVTAFESEKFSRNIDFAKYCSFTNNDVLNVNSFVRGRLHKDKASTIILKDDLLTAYSTILDEFLSPIIVNSEDYIIDDIQEYRNQSGIKGFIVRFLKVFGKQYTPYMFIVDTSDQNNLMAFLTIANKLIREAKTAHYTQRSNAWDKFYDFKNNNLLINTVFDDKGKVIVTKDIDYGYCLTIHKTQGSTYNNVFVNTRDIIYNKRGRPYADQIMRGKLLYVAISRAMDTATILI